MLYEASLICNITRAADEKPELFAELESMVFGDNYKKFCDIKKVRETNVTEDNVLDTKYQLNFYKAEDATMFKLKFQVLLE